jgi:hypothetical protein
MADETYPQELKYYKEHDWVRIEGVDAVVLGQQDELFSLERGGDAGSHVLEGEVEGLAGR